MPSQNIVQDIRILIQNNLLPVVPTKWWPQLGFGLEAFSLRPFQSAGSNARTVVDNAHTAASKVFRLLGNEKLASHLGLVFDQFHLVTPSSFVNVDHSDVNGLTALVGALQTRSGRAVPCFIETTYAHHIPAEGSVRSTPRWQKLRAAMVEARRTQSFTGHTIDALQDFADRLGFWPKLVFDRGFGNESMVTHLAAEGATFYIRLKASRYCEYAGRRLSVLALKRNDQVVVVSGLTLRVIRSFKDRRSPEPWYILTNDTTSSRNKIVKIYYHRFEIEESFKDAKHLFECRRVSLMKPQSLKMLLWLVFLGIALLYVASNPTKRQANACHNKKQTSWIRHAYERFQRELISSRGLTGLAPRLSDRGIR